MLRYVEFEFGACIYGGAGGQFCPLVQASVLDVGNDAQLLNQFGNGGGIGFRFTVVLRQPQPLVAGLK